MITKRCACCGQTFEPLPQVPDQAFCSSPDCQRARRRQWQRDKLKSDGDYRINQQDAQLAWTQRNQDYWRIRRGASIGYDPLLQRSVFPANKPRDRDSRGRAALTPALGWVNFRG